MRARSRFASFFNAPVLASTRGSRINSPPRSVRRGRRYLEIASSEISGARGHAITVDGELRRSHVLPVAIANGRQYGNGASIAPTVRR
jgi:hypothetical protein